MGRIFENFFEKSFSPLLTYADGCHYDASVTAQDILKKVNAKYVYGVSATPMRSDNLEKINHMLLGLVRHKYTALERTMEQGIEHLVIPRYTRVIGRRLLIEIKHWKAPNRVGSDELSGFL